MKGLRRRSCSAFILSARFVLSLALPLTVLAQADDFNDGNDDGWTRLDLRAAGQPPSTFSFPPDDSGGAAYRIVSPPPRVSTYGPARAISYLSNSFYTNFTVSVDILDWNNSLDQGFGVGTRGGNIGLGRSLGYLFNVNPHQFPQIPGTAGELQINRITREVPLTIARAVVSLDPTHQYRLIASGFGPHLIARLYDLADLTTPLASTDVADTNYTGGTVAVLVFSHVPSGQETNATSSADVTFDNFFATGSAPPSQAPPVYHGPRQVIDSTQLSTSQIDDFTEHTYASNGVPIRAFAESMITRIFSGQIKNIKVSVVTGNADDVGYAGELLVTPETAALPCSVPGFVINPIDVTSQVSIATNSASLSLRAQNICGLNAGWGADTIAGRSNARLHWQVELEMRPAPVAVATVSPLIELSTDDTNLLVLSPNDSTAAVTFDASTSSDANHSTLEFSWFDDSGIRLLGTGVRLTNNFSIGEHTVMLIASSGQATATNHVTFTVITHAQAVAALVLQAEEADFGGRNKQALIASLNAAIRAFERHNFTAAANQLRTFQQKLRAPRGRNQSALNEQLLRISQVLMESRPHRE